MSTEKPRITVTLEPRLYEVVRRLAKANGQTMSRVIVDFLGVAEGPMRRAVTILERAAHAPGEARDRVRGSLHRAERSVVPVLLEGLRQTELELDREGLDWYDLAESGAGREGGGSLATRPAPPVAVTRGVGTPLSKQKPAKKGRSRA